LAALGLQNKEIAEKLFLSPNSVKKYLYDIYQILEENNRFNAIHKVKQLHLI
jgi:DNA-binding NarL/FixJ family response regulator